MKIKVNNLKYQFKFFALNSLFSAFSGPLIIFNTQQTMKLVLKYVFDASERFKRSEYWQKHETMLTFLLIIDFFSYPLKFFSGFV